MSSRSQDSVESSLQINGHDAMNRRGGKKRKQTSTVEKELSGKEPSNETEKPKCRKTMKVMPEKKQLNLFKN